MLDTILEVLNVLGYISTVIVILSAIVATVLCFRGFVPVLIRLGNGLWKRKIAIIAKGDALIGLENMLHDSKLFNRTNILKIPSESDLGIAEQASLFLVYWPDWKDNDDMEKILAHKEDSTALIVYAPQEHGFIPQPVMHALEKKRNVVVNNFRGRLLNDIVVSMITTGYEKK
ncbi:MAG: hypothetical protein JO019_04935 [Candidatus Kaiserbacteria bacterium]|nr:hypothetical protein [Candidatus Kaiserbacteria bacterium]